MFTIPFNKPFLTGSETKYIEQAVASGKISGDGMFTKRCQQLLEHRQLLSVAPISFPQPSAPVNTFYIDPVNGSMSGDGSQARPD